MASYCYRCMQNTVHAGRCTSCGAPTVKRSESDMNLLPLGTKLDHGHVIVGDKLGAGGFGVTYIARDDKYGLIALKEFVPRYMIVGKRNGVALEIDESKRQVYEKCLAGFRREARVLNELRHPNIVRVLFEMEEQGTAYYGMELLQGCTLAQWLTEHERIAPKEACRLLLPIMNALIFMHNRGVLHRDISPDNIFLRTAQGEYMDVSPCLIDFGAAYIAIDDFTRTYPKVKKKGYSPPDQNVEMTNQRPRIDVYAFAATVYYMLTGTPPPPSDDRLSGDQELIPPKRLNEDISDSVEELLMSGLKLNSRERIQTMAEFKARFCQATGVTEPEPARKISATRGVMGNDAVQEPGRSGRWRYIAAILIEAAVFTLVPTAFLATIAPLHGLLMGTGLMFAVNLLLSRESPGLTFGQRILGMNDLPPLTRPFAYNLMRCILPWSLLDEGAALTGLMKLSFVERHFRQTAAEESPGTTGCAPDTSGTSAARQTAWLMCCAQSRRGERIWLAKSQSLGCDETRCDVVLSHTDRMVSHCHCNIYYSGVSSQAVGWYISDNNSTNGTFVNGNRLPKNAESVLLADGDRLTIGSEDYIFRVE